MRRIVKAWNLCLLMFAIILTSSLVTTHLAHAAISDVELYVDPALNQYGTSTPLHTRFNVTVMWKDTGTTLNEVFAWQITMYYNLTLLNCTRAWQPVWDSDYIFYGQTTVKPPAGFLPDNVAIMDTLYSGSASAALKKLTILEMDIMYIPPEGVVVSSALNINNADSYWSPDGIDWNNPTLTDGIYYIPEFSLAIMFLTLFATSTAAVVLHKKR
jgi:hypothetical protein